MIRTFPAPRVEVVPARGEPRHVVRRILIVDEVDRLPQSSVDLLARTRVERTQHFDVPRFSS